MEKLPQELVDKICGFLSNKNLINVLTLSTEFQHAAEDNSGAFTGYTIDGDNIDNNERFVQIYSGRRLRYLREVRFNPSFPPAFYSQDDEKPCRESEQELREKDESFTHQIKFLFAVLLSVD